MYTMTRNQLVPLQRNPRKTLPRVSVQVQEDVEDEIQEDAEDAAPKAGKKTKAKVLCRKVRAIVHRLNRSCRELSFLFVADPKDEIPSSVGAAQADILVRERTADDEGRLTGIGAMLCRLHFSDERQTWLLYPLAETQGAPAVVDCGKDTLSLLQEVEAFCGFGLRHPFKERADKKQILARAESAEYQQARKESLERAQERGKTDFVRVDKDGHIIGHYTSKRAALQGILRGQKALSAVSAENKLDHWDAYREKQQANGEKVKQRKLEERATSHATKAALKTEGGPSEVTMAAQKWTAARIIETAKKHKVSIKALHTACGKLLALPAPDAAPAKPSKPSAKPKAGLSGIALMQACKKAYAAFKAKTGKEPNAAQKAQIKAALQGGKIAPKKPAPKKPAPKKPAAKKPAAKKPKVKVVAEGKKDGRKKKKVPGRHVLTPAQLKKGQAMLKKCQAFRSKHGRWPNEAEKAKLRAA